MRPLRIVAIIAGCVLVLPAIVMILGGAALGLGHAFGRDADGFFETTIDQVETATVAVTADELDLTADPAGPSWILDQLDAEVRFIVEDSSKEMFIGIAPKGDVDSYLAGVAHNEVVELDDDLTPIYRYRDGSPTATPPGAEQFWVASAEGETPLTLKWNPTEGTWTVVLMNADGSAGVLSDVNVGVKANFVLTAALVLMGLGTILLPITIGLIIYGTTSEKDLTPRDSAAHPGFIASHSHLPTTARKVHPVALEASLDPQLSKWKWLVKWILALPHVVVLIFLWIAFSLLTVVAGVSIFVTGRYPRSIFDFNVGVIRWSWRVSYYAATGGLGTDQYPPFSLDPQPGDLATLEVEYPDRLSRTLVLVKWWLLAIPHYLIVGILVGDFGWVNADGSRVSGLSLMGLFCVIAGVSLLVTGHYPRSLFDLIIGLNRWMYRVLVYAALMTDTYPPFRLDQGGTEPTSNRGGPPQSHPDEGIDLRPEPSKVEMR
ncbi:MAG: DUF4389 domain-containing protein [Acidimicrobiales bacterium]